MSIGSKLASYETYYNNCYQIKDIENNQVLQRYIPHDYATVILEDGTKQQYKSGGPYQIGDASNVYVGDIWVMAGQSNMRGHGYQIDPYTNRSLIEHPQPSIHLFNSEEEWVLAKEPLHQLYLSKRTVHHTLPDPTVKNPSLLDYRGASLGLSFAKHYQNKNSNIPVGLVASAHGGTSLDDWKRPSYLNKKTEDTTLYGAMMARIKAVGGVVAGILWYQGESDTNTIQEASSYETRFRQWLEHVRMDASFPLLPIAFVQIGPHAIDVKDTITNWQTVQIAQFHLMLEQEFAAGVSSIDCSLDDRLHLSAAGLKTVGERLAVVATRLADPFDVSGIVKKNKFYAHYQEPLMASMKGIIPPCILFTVDEQAEYNSDYKYDISGFGLECSDKSVAIIHAKANKGANQVLIWISHKPKVPLLLTYGLKYPLFDSFKKGWPAFQILVE